MTAVHGQRTLSAVEKVWKELRPSCRNDRSAINKVTEYINHHKLTLRPLSPKTVMQITSSLKLREKLTRRPSRLISPNGVGIGKTHTTSIGTELERLLHIISLFSQLEPASKLLLIHQLNKEMEFAG